MKLVKAEINNYKSFKNEDNILFVDDVNVVIGKNESGKSNLIDAISEVGIFDQIHENLFIPKNKNTDDDISLKLWFVNYPTETEIVGETVIEIFSSDKCLVSGAMSEYVKNNKQIKLLYSQLIELRKDVTFSQNTTRVRTDSILERLANLDSEILILPDYYESVLNVFLNSSVEKYKLFGDILKEIVSVLELLYCKIPFFVKVNDKTLKSKYLLKDVEGDLLEEFLEVCEIDIDKLKSVMSSSNATDIKNFERTANKKIIDNFTEEFNNFYSQEKVLIEFAIMTNELSILIDTSNKYMSYDERSNGLKWYLNIFIQLLYMERKNCRTPHNNVILIDEPGVYLHANAQRELYSLIKKISTNENQVIFTTHSPFMLDCNELQNIRAIIKDKDGNSHIHNKITTIPSGNSSTFDTITPLLYALGLDMNYNIGPNVSKKNIIVEGMSDYLYLHAYFFVKGVLEKDKPNIIPSTGADNIFAIASILYGWGCNFTILLDQDEKGRAKYDSFQDRNHPFLDKIIFADGTSEKQTNDFEIEDLFSDGDKDLFGINNKDYNGKKYNYSYLTYNSIVQKEKEFSDETIEKFDRLNLLD